MKKLFDNRSINIEGQQLLASTSHTLLHKANDNRVDINSFERERIWSRLKEDSYKKFSQMVEVDNDPNILMGAMEFGTIELKGEPITAKVGGLAVVVNDMIKNFPKFLNSRGGGKVSFVFMAFDGVPEGRYVKQFQINIAGRIETLTLYKFIKKNGATIFFLDHPLFKRRSIRQQHRNLYQPDPGELYTGRSELEAPFELSLFNRGIAEVAKLINANIYHAHDYQTGLASIYLDSNIVSSITIHNAGPGHRGIYYAEGFGTGRAAHPNYAFGVPTGDYGANDYLLRILGVDFDTYMRYFEENGTFNSLKITKYIAEKNLIAGIPVSQGYANELDMGLLDGIENGLDEIFHAKDHPFLKRKPESRLASIHNLITDPRVRREWFKGLNYGTDLNGPSGIKKVHERKKKLKEMLQITAELEVNPNRPLFVAISRLVDQKNIQIFAENIAHIVSRGGQVIIAGQPGDSKGHQLASRINHLEYLPEHHGSVRFYNTFMNKELAVLIQAGADFFVSTSKFEPCGLTDIEAIWLGTIPVTRKTGGLGKVRNSFTYEWHDTYNVFGEIDALKHTLDHILEFYYTRYEEFKGMRIEGMKENFSWKDALNKYFENYRTAALFKLLNDVEHQFNDNFDKRFEIEKTLLYVFAKLPNKMLQNYRRILLKKEWRTGFDSFILTTIFKTNDVVEEKALRPAPLKLHIAKENNRKYVA